MKYLELLLITWIMSISCLFGQIDSPATAIAIIEAMRNAQHTPDSRQYKAEMRFKGMDMDTFEIRNCKIQYRTDSLNLLYGYDWMYEEKFAQGYTLSLLLLPDGEYTIFSDDTVRLINHRLLPNQIEIGTYTETMRNYFLLDQVIDPFITVSASEIVLSDSSEYYLLTRKISNHAYKKLLINKHNFLPSRAIDVIRDPEFDLIQVLDISFNYPEKMNTVDDTAFSVEQYIKAGFEYKFYNALPPDEDVNFHLTSELEEVLLDYPFVSDITDTAYIHDSEAKYILLDFWFASCQPCLKSMPELSQLSETYSNDLLEVIGINCYDKTSSKMLTSKLRAKGINFPLLFGERPLLNRLGIKNFPTYILINSERNMQIINGGSDEVKLVLKDKLAK